MSQIQELSDSTATGASTTSFVMLRLLELAEKNLEILERMEQRQALKDLARQQASQEKESSQLSDQIGSSLAAPKVEEEKPEDKINKVTSGMIMSPIGASRVEAGKRAGSETYIVSHQPKQIEWISEEEKAELLSFEQHTWKPPLTEPKIEIHVFTREYAEGWELRLESYFERGKGSKSEKLQTLEVYGLKFIVLTTRASEVTERVWEKTVMIGLRVKIRLGFGRNFKMPIIVAKMVGGWSDTATTCSAIKAGEEEGHRFSQSGQYKSTCQFLHINSSQDGPGLFHVRPKISSIFVKQTTPYTCEDIRTPNSDHRREAPDLRGLTTATKWIMEGLIFPHEEKWHTHHHGSDKELKLLVVRKDGSQEHCGECAEEIIGDGVQEIPQKAGLFLNSALWIVSPKISKIRVVAFKAVELKLHNSSITFSLPLQELRSVAVSLEIRWLYTWGVRKVKWALQVMRFKMQKVSVTLRGDSNLCDSAIFRKSLWYVLDHHEEDIEEEYESSQSQGGVFNASPRAELVSMSGENLVVVKGEDYRSLTGSEVIVQGMGVCEEVEFMLQRLTLTKSFLLAELGSVGVILDIHWLETFGKTNVTYTPHSYDSAILEIPWSRTLGEMKLQMLKVELNGEKVTLNGDPCLCCVFISLKSLLQTLVQQGKINRDSELRKTSGETQLGETKCHEFAEFAVVLTNLFIKDDHNIILGMQWFELLGEVKVNWILRAMKLLVLRERVLLRDDNALSHALASLKLRWKAVRRQDYAMIMRWKWQVVKLRVNIYLLMLRGTSSLSGTLVPLKSVSRVLDQRSKEMLVENDGLQTEETRLISNPRAALSPLLKARNVLKKTDARRGNEELETRIYGPFECSWEWKRTRRCSCTSTLRTRSILKGPVLISVVYCDHKKKTLRQRETQVRCPLSFGIHEDRIKHHTLWTAHNT